MQPSYNTWQELYSKGYGTLSILTSYKQPYEPYNYPSDPKPQAPTALNHKPKP